MSIEIIESHSIVPELVSRGGIVIDCGANLGAFSMEMIRRFECRCYAFEASPLVFSRLPKHPCLVAQNFAICGSDRNVWLALNEDSTRNTLMATIQKKDRQIEIKGRHLGRLMSDLRVTWIEVLKMDIEGAELEVLDSLNDHFFHNVGQVTIEFHDFLGYSSTKEVEERIRRIIDIGFREMYWSRRRNTGDVLLVNKRRMGPLRHAYEQQIIRRVRAAGRLWLRTACRIKTKSRTLVW
jgi:FkbM family methyltransferase